MPVDLTHHLTTYPFTDDIIPPSLFYPVSPIMPSLSQSDQALANARMVKSLDEFRKMAERSVPNFNYLNKITLGDSLELVPLLADESLDCSIIDPPYGEAMGYAGDSTLTEAEGLLYSFLRAVHPKLKKNAHIAIFFTMRNVDVVIDAVRAIGFTFRRVVPMYVPRGGARPYLGWLPRTQAIVIAQKYLPSQPSEMHGQIAEYLWTAMQAKGLSRGQVARELGCDSRLVMKWTRVGDPAWCLITPRFYTPLKKLLGLDDTYDFMMEREPQVGGGGRSDFTYKHDCYIVDEKRTRDPIHPSEKPISVLEHIVECLAPVGGVVLDGFSGSGSTAEACENTGRKFIAFEIGEEYIVPSQCRVAQAQVSRLLKGSSNPDWDIIHDPSVPTGDIAELEGPIALVGLGDYEEHGESCTWCFSASGPRYDRCECGGTFGGEAWEALR